MRKIIAVVAAAAVAALLAGPAGAKPAQDAPTTPDAIKYCPTGPYVVYVTQQVSNDLDVGTLGNAWAVTNYTRKIQVVRVMGNTYCAAVSYSGSFQTLPGFSPGGTGFVEGGLTGPISGSYRTTIFSGTFRPLVPVSGTFSTDYACSAPGVCPGYVNWVQLYFGNVLGLGIARWAWQYNTSSNGWWYTSNQLPTYGDVSG